MAICFYDEFGEKLSGGLVYFYEDNFSAPKDIYADKDLTTAHCNPIVLDCNGESPEVFLGEGPYDIKVCDSYGNVKCTQPNVFAKDSIPKCDDSGADNINYKVNNASRKAT